MGDQHDALRKSLGPVGAWTFAFNEIPYERVAAAARSIEELGFGALWVPEGFSSREIFAHLSLLLSATDRIAVCSGIANIGRRDPVAMANGIRTLQDAFGDRVVVGIGVGHQYQYESRDEDWGRPLQRMIAYLDGMDSAPWLGSELPPQHRLLAALRPRMLGLAAERSLGAHTYFVPVEHTARARKTLGDEPVLAVEQTAVLTTEPSAARSLGRAFAADYVDLPNYANNLLSLGFSAEDLADGGSDRLIDATVSWGSVDKVRERVREHLDAGADHVTLQVISGGDDPTAMRELRELAPALRSLV